LTWWKHASHVSQDILAKGLVKVSLNGNDFKERASYGGTRVWPAILTYGSLGGGTAEDWLRMITPGATLAAACWVDGPVVVRSKLMIIDLCKEAIVFSALAVLERTIWQ